MNIPYGRQDITPADIKAIIEVLESDFLTQGPKVPLFEKAEKGFVEKLVIHLKSEVYIPGDEVVSFGDEGDKMYFINSGSLDVIIENGSVVASLSDGNFFGEMALLMDTKRTATIRCNSYCDLLSLNREDFNLALEEYPLFAKEMKKVAKARQNK